MKNSLEFSVESFFIRLFQADKRLKGKNIVHADEEQKAKSNAIIIEAKEGNNTLAAFGGSELDVTVEFRATGKSTKARNDLIVSAIRGVVYNSTLDFEARADITRNVGLIALLIKDESTSDRQNTNDFRKRTVTFPLQAKLA